MGPLTGFKMIEGAGADADGGSVLETHLKEKAIHHCIHRKTFNVNLK